MQAYLRNLGQTLRPGEIALLGFEAERLEVIVYAAVEQSDGCCEVFIKAVAVAQELKCTGRATLAVRELLSRVAGSAQPVRLRANIDTENYAAQGWAATVGLEPMESPSGTSTHQQWCLDHCSTGST